MAKKSESKKHISVVKIILTIALIGFTLFIMRSCDFVGYVKNVTADGSKEHPYTIGYNPLHDCDAYYHQDAKNLEEKQTLWYQLTAVHDVLLEVQTNDGKNEQCHFDIKKGQIYDAQMNSIDVLHRDGDNLTSPIELKEGDIIYIKLKISGAEEGDILCIGGMDATYYDDAQPTSEFDEYNDWENLLFNEDTGEYRSWSTTGVDHEQDLWCRITIDEDSDYMRFCVTEPDAYPMVVNASLYKDDKSDEIEELICPGPDAGSRNYTSSFRKVKKGEVYLMRARLTPIENEGNVEFYARPYNKYSALFVEKFEKIVRKLGL